MSTEMNGHRDGAAAQEPARDLYDAISFVDPGSRSSLVQNIAAMPVERDSHFYNMKHPRRGKAIIFNHMEFEPILGLNKRNGTDKDCENLYKELLSLEFDITILHNGTTREIDEAVHTLAQDPCHKESDCVLVAVFSHGDANQLYARDNPYKPEMLWSPFTAEKCRDLAGKPKFFIIQACQGDRLDNSVTLIPGQYRTSIDSSAGLSYKIPNHADFLIAYSTIPGFFSWRNTTNGSWFIQALCRALRDYASREDFLSILTIASRIVATEFQSNTPGNLTMHEKKQIPCLTSLLTRKVMFFPKRR